MPSSQPDAFNPGELRSYLGKTLENSQFDEERVDSHYLPLLILEWTHVRAAFAFSNGSLETSYETLYQGFKRLYARDRARWDALDRAFVFCVHPGTADLDRFCSSVETDVYFCRKFVVALIDPISKSLARLPFLPLNPIEGEHPLRPPSAQTLLKSYGVPAPLASVVVVPGQLSAERIVERCKENQYGEPVLSDLRSPARGPTAERDREPVLIDTIAIENFRAYRRRQVFELGSGVTVLYGPNGFGKTSFFDAVDFAITGGIGRIDERGAQFGRLARHLDSQNEDSSVQVSFRSGGSSLRLLTRTVDRPNQAELDGRAVDRKAVLRILTGGTAEGSDHIGNLVSLFRATHLFSQEQQELTRNFENDCLPKETVSRMLAFEDYASASTKLEDVCGLLRSAIQKGDAEEKDRAAEIDLVRRELAGYRLPLATDPDGAGLTRAMSDLRDRLVALNVAEPGAEMTAADLRRWRGKLELLISESDARVARLTQLQSLAPRLASIPGEIDEAAAKAQVLEKDVEAARERLEIAEHDERKVADQIATNVAALKSAQELAAAIRWCRTTKARHSELILAREKAAEEARLLVASLDVQRADEERVSATAESLADTVKSLADQSEQLQGRLTLFENIEQRAAMWREQQSRLAAVANAEERGTQESAVLHAQGESLRLALAAVDSEVGRLLRELERVDQTTTDFRRLLLDIQRYVESPTCPVCGAQHESQDDLLSKITVRLEGDPASEQRSQLADVRGRRKELEEELARTAEAQKLATSTVEDRKRERGALNAGILDFVSAAEAAGVVLTSPIISAEDDIKNRLARLSEDRKLVVDQRTQVGRELETARAGAASLRASIASGARELARLHKAIDRLGVDIATLEGDPAAQLVPLNTEAAVLDAREAVCREEIGRADIERVKLETARTDRRAASAGAKKSLETLNRDLRECRSTLATLQTERSQGDAVAKAASMPAGATATLAAARVNEEIARRTELAAARESTSAVEIGIDSATTAASHDRLRRDIQAKEKELSVVISARDANRPWLSFFQAVAQLVSTQQSRAITAFTTEYGPRASTIQRRLRPVYGFDDVEVRSEDSAIVVRVHRGKDELHPTEYFSQSQVQTLMLSLFLTACVSQTWSSLSPIFLDDPVTHFDDLNTYAFLDLVVGLLDVEGHGRQFVLSTCDEKFLQLARQKFRHLGQAAKFYQFSAIGAEGPVVAQLA